MFKKTLRGSEFSITRGQAEVSQATIWQGCQRPVVLQVFHKSQNHPESLLKWGRLGPTPEFLIQGVWDQAQHTRGPTHITHTHTHTHTHTQGSTRITHTYVHTLVPIPPKTTSCHCHAVIFHEKQTNCISLITSPDFLESKIVVIGLH